jgi:hypothetical protein
MSWFIALHSKYWIYRVPPIKRKLEGENTLSSVMYICMCSTHMSVHMPTATDNHLTRPDLFPERYFDKDLASLDKTLLVRGMIFPVIFSGSASWRHCGVRLLHELRVNVPSFWTIIHSVGYTDTRLHKPIARIIMLKWFVKLLRVYIYIYIAK